MRFFHAQFYKNIIWMYLFGLGCFCYHTMLSVIPDHVYLQEGEELELDCMLPVSFAVAEDGLTGKEVIADISASTYETMQSRGARLGGGTLEVGEHAVVCYLFGIVPVKEVEVSVVEGKSLYAAGHVVGIYGATQGVLVLKSSPVETVDGTYEEPAEHVVFPGDYIVAVNGEAVEKKEQLIARVNEDGGQPLTLTLWRKDEKINVSVHAVEVSVRQQEAGSASSRANERVNSQTAYMLGLWVKDDMAGIGTLTYYDTYGYFGALGHGIGDGQTGSLLRIGEGELYESEILGIVKGRRGTPGEIQGIVHYGHEHEIGEVERNTDIGIYGKLDDSSYEAFCTKDTLYAVGYKQDVTTGDAELLSDVSGDVCAYHIVIDSLDYSPADHNKGIRFHVDDESLIGLTGGIVQGLSGSPIVQDGHLVGAVTHVLVNEPTQGYGIFIENMIH